MGCAARPTRFEKAERFRARSPGGIERDRAGVGGGRRRRSSAAGSRSGPARQEAAGAGIAQKLFEASCLERGHGPAERSQAIVAAANVVVFGVGAFIELFDETAFEQAANAAVERAGADGVGNSSAGRDVAEDGVAM